MRGKIMLRKQLREPESAPPKRNRGRPKKRRGRPEKLYKIDDTPLNVARSLFRIPSDKFARPKT